mmetsp:Transcript_46698/g.56526  ORF Transcript_46698/g.56526 Transcript_46698/m.56526 type:complete len:465 (-) Transcript_46698:315-1709(-)
MEQGASQSAIAEHVSTKLSVEQQGVLTQALLNTNSSVVHGVTVSSVLLSTEGFINGLAAVAQDALELSGSDVMLLAVVYDAKSSKRSTKSPLRTSAISKYFAKQKLTKSMLDAEAWKGGEDALKRRRIRAAFNRRDLDGSGYLDRSEVKMCLSNSGVVASDEAISSVMSELDLDSDGKISYSEFQTFVEKVEREHHTQESQTGKRAATMIIIGRVKTGVNLKHVNLNKLFQAYGGGGHAKAASASVRLSDETEADGILDTLVVELVKTSLQAQPTVGDFMTAPVLSAKPEMTEKQVEDLFTRYDVRALPVVNDNNEVIGLVTYKEVAAAKERLWNKEQKKLRNENNKKHKANKHKPPGEQQKPKQRKLGSALKGWMKQHVRIVEAGMTMAEVENLLMETDVGCIPVVADGTKHLVGMVTRTDILRQHRYYPTLHYHNKGFSDSIAARKPIIELRKRLKKFDFDE